MATRAFVVAVVAIGALCLGSSRGGSEVLGAAPDLPSGRADSGNTPTAAWTDVEMREARQAPLPTIDDREIRPRTAMIPPTGRAGSRPPEDTDELHRPPGFFVPANVAGTPYKWAGKLFYRKPDGGRFECSAQFITRDVVLTAAHCVRDKFTGQWFSDHVFALQYNRGNSTHRYRVRCPSTLTGWVQSNLSTFQKIAYDYAMLLVDGGTRTGFFGTKWNWWGSHQWGTKIGYPSGYAKGQVIQTANANFESVTEGVIQMYHDVNAYVGGSSGGALIADFAAYFSNTSNFVISVNAAQSNSDARRHFGPYFTEAFNALLEFTQRGCR